MSNYIRRGLRSPYIRLSDAQEREIVSRYLNLETTTRIAPDYGVCASRICKVLIKHDVTRRGSAFHARKHFTDDEEALIVSMWNGGYPGLSIAGHLGCSRQRVYKTLRKHGIEYQPRSRRGELHHGWRGGRNVNNNGYVCIVVPDDHPFVSMRQGSSRHVLEHRLVMAEYLGRPLLTHETVHHIDGDKAHNVIENLQLRIGSHGVGTPYCCLDCGSDRIGPAELKEASP